MEIKRIIKEEVKYAVQKDVDEKVLKKNIPNRWKKLGITAAIFGMIMKCRTTFAASMGWKEIEPIHPPMITAGVVQTTSILDVTLKWPGRVVLGIAGVLSITYCFIKKEKDLEKLKKFKNIIVTLLIIGIVLLALSQLLPLL